MTTERSRQISLPLSYTGSLLSRLVGRRAPLGESKVSGRASFSVCAPVIGVLLLSGCSTVGDTWDSVFSGEEEAAASTTADAGQDAVTAKATEGLIAPGERPGYATGKGRKEPTATRALVESKPKPKAEVEAKTPEPAPVATPVPASVPTPASAPVQAAAPEPVPEPVPVPDMAATGIAGDGTIVIGGDGQTYTPSQAALPVDEPFVDPLTAFDATSGMLVATIQFTNGSSSLSGVDRGILKQVAVLQRQHNARVRIIGHASGRTRDMDLARHKAVNLEVSLRRAEAVASGLAAQGVSRSRIVVAAAAAADPIYTETMPAGEAGNRRAEIYLEY